MPRWPAGMHIQTGSQRAVGQASYRIPVTTPRAYWRRTVSTLHAGANAVIVSIPGGFPADPLIPAMASAGPQGAGESWLVDIVQVQAAGQVGAAPLVSQQIAAQQLGTTTEQPPPITAQAWLQIGGVNMYLLAQSNTGGNDAMSVSCPPLCPGERIAVVWYGWAPAPGSLPYMTLRGTRYSLVDQ